MGGKAFSELNIVRLNKDENEEISSKLVRFLRQSLGTSDVSVLPYYKDKPSFGDIDIILTHEDISNFENKIKSDFYEYFQKETCSPRIANNGGVISFAYQKNNQDYVQVDLMPHPKEQFNKIIQYFAYNDLCILISRFISIPVFNARYTPDGCEINVYRDDDSYECLLGIAKTENKLVNYLHFLDLDVERFKCGFNSKNELYQFVTDSRFFDFDNFKQAIGVDNISEKERQNRDVYRGFIDYVIDNKQHKKMNKMDDPQNYLFSHFPELKMQYDYFKNEYKKYIFFKSKFNGENIGKILNIDCQDRVLGKVMKSFLKNRVLSENKELIDTVNNMSDNEFNAMILNKHKELYQNVKSVDPKFKKRVF